MRVSYIIYKYKSIDHVMNLIGLSFYFWKVSYIAQTNLKDKLKIKGQISIFYRIQKKKKIVYIDINKIEISYISKNYT